jgi:hypothetical protein
MRRTAGGTQPAHFDDLAGDREAAVLAEPAQAFDDRLVLDLLRCAAIVADHELAFVRVLDVVARDKRTRTLDFVDKLVRQQKIKRTINRGRPEFAALALEGGEQRICADRLAGGEDQFEHPPAHRRQLCTARGAEVLGAPQGALDVPRSQGTRFPCRFGVIYASKVQCLTGTKQQSDRGQIGLVSLGCAPGAAAGSGLMEFAMRLNRLRLKAIAAWLSVTALGLHALVPIHLAFNLAAASSRSLECGRQAVAPYDVHDASWHLLALLTGRAEGSDHPDPRHGAHQPAQWAVCGALVTLAGFAPAASAILPLPVRLEPARPPLRLAEIRADQTPLFRYCSRAPPFDARSTT